MIARLALAALLALAPTMNDCGGDTQWDQPAQKRPAQCAPKVHFPRPAKGTVVDIKQCAGLFGITTTYVRINVADSRAVVWAVDPSGGARCPVGAEWDTGLPNGCPT